MKRKPIFLIDMDSITVDMTPTWLKIYHERTGEKLLRKHHTEWAFGKIAKYPKELNAIYEEDGFFANLPPMPNAPEYITKLLEKKVDVIFLTQLPRRSDFAAKDKRLWIEKHIPKFDQRNVIFAHRKHIVCGDLLFDDNPIHLRMWKEFHDFQALTATIDYPYNKDSPFKLADWRFKVKSRAWKDFYERSCDSFNLK
jgi:5'-nucleotidase